VFGCVGLIPGSAIALGGEMSGRCFSIFRVALLSTAVMVSTITAVQAESLNAAIHRAVSEHPEVLALVANKDAIDHELEAAKGLARPKINVEAKSGYLIDNNTDQMYTEGAIKLVHPLYDGGRAKSEKTRQKERVNSAERRAEDAATTIALQVVQAYLEVQRSRLVAQIASENLKSTQAIVGRVANRVNAGLSDNTDMEQARARLYSAKDSKAEASLHIQDAATLYFTAVGTEPDKLKTPELPRGYLAKSLASVIAQSKDASPKILALQHDAEAADAAINTARAAIRPKLDAELSANYRDEIDGSSAENTSFKAMLVMSFDLYDGGINQARVKEAQARAEEARYHQDAARLSVEREIRLAWNAYSSMGERVKIYKNQAKSNKTLMHLRLDQYEAGTSSLIGVLDAQSESFIAAMRAINEEYAGRFAYYKMLAASGQLLEALRVYQTASAD
jgi:adhesin transport system outer membrane protein